MLFFTTNPTGVDLFTISTEKKRWREKATLAVLEKTYTHTQREAVSNFLLPRRLSLNKRDLFCSLDHLRRRQANSPARLAERESQRTTFMLQTAASTLGSKPVAQTGASTRRWRKTAPGVGEREKRGRKRTIAPVHGQVPTTYACK